jgi:2-amino-4-hydroxy-6-hydroxymethyldihydropteridine diphosphokinase
MERVFIALGSNLGDRQNNLDRALEALAAIVRITSRSSVYETDPAYVIDQPSFLNMVVAGETGLAADALLSELKRIEADIGRVPTRRNGPRVIDLDILYYADQIIETDVLIVPHPRIAERVFVLEPLAEIAPELRHPIMRMTTRELLERLREGQ